VRHPGAVHAAPDIVPPAFWILTYSATVAAPWLTGNILAQPGVAAALTIFAEPEWQALGLRCVIHKTPRKMNPAGTGELLRIIARTHFIKLPDLQRRNEAATAATRQDFAELRAVQ